jgi:hypothetical protein
VLNLVYYLAVELVPSALVLFILRKLPPKVTLPHTHAKQPKTDKQTKIKAYSVRSRPAFLYVGKGHGLPIGLLDV